MAQQSKQNSMALAISVQSRAQPAPAPLAAASPFANGFQIGNPPYHNVKVTVMNPGNCGTFIGEISRAMLVGQVRNVFASMLGVCADDTEMLYQGNKLVDNIPMSGHSFFHAPSKRGTADIVYYVNGVVELNQAWDIPVSTGTDKPEWHYCITGEKPRMCGQCGSGPVSNEACHSLSAHNVGRCNHCPVCGWFDPDWMKWPAWDGGKKLGTWQSAKR